MINIYILLMFLGTLLTAISQILLKISAGKEFTRPLFEYLNWRVMVSYGLFFGVLLLNTYAYTRVPMKYGAVIDTFSYVFVMILSRFILREQISKGKIIGNIIIITGVLIYTLP